MKLTPKNIKFCPGCPKTDFKLKSAPQLIIETENKADTKNATMLPTKAKKTNSTSLF